MPQVIIAVVITLIITAVAVWFISTEYHKKVAIPRLEMQKSRPEASSTRL